MILFRLCLILTVILMTASTVMAGDISPEFRAAAIVLLLLIIARAGKKLPKLTTLGSARFADVDDLRRAGMLGAKSGLILGRVKPDRSSILRAIRNLLNVRVSSESACRYFIGLFHRPKFLMVRLSNAVHVAIFAPTGVGKGVSCVIPFLLTTDEPCIVLDVKNGELAKLTADTRRKMGRKVHILDPYRCITDTPATLNPVQFIDKGSRYAIDDSRDIAAAIVERKEEKGDGIHFLDNAEAAIAALIAAVVEYGEGDHQRSLQAVCDIASKPKKFEQAIQLMIAHAAQEGMLARMGGNLMHLKDREQASTMSTIARFLRFLGTPAVAASTKTSSFNPNEILDGNTDVYCVLPSDRVATLSPLLRLWTGTFLRTALRSDGKTRINFICDEAGSSLGKMVELETALTVGRSAGVRLQLYFQDRGQLTKYWPNGADQTLLANCTEVYFGVSDQQTAEYVSNRLGEETIIVTSGGTSGSQSVQTSSTGQSSTRSHNWNEAWQQQARKLLTAQEVTALSPRMAITFAPGVPGAVFTKLVRYYEERLGPGRWWERLYWSKGKLAADCIALLLVAIVITVGVFIVREQHVTPARLPRVSQRTKEPHAMPFQLPGGSQPRIEPHDTPFFMPGGSQPTIEPRDMPFWMPGGSQPMKGR